MADDAPDPTPTEPKTETRNEPTEPITPTVQPTVENQLEAETVQEGLPIKVEQSLNPTPPLNDSHDPISIDDDKENKEANIHAGPFQLTIQPEISNITDKGHFRGSNLNRDDIGKELDGIINEAVFFLASRPYEEGPILTREEIEKDIPLLQKYLSKIINEAEEAVFLSPSQPRTSTCEPILTRAEIEKDIPLLEIFVDEILNEAQGKIPISKVPAKATKDVPNRIDQESTNETSTPAFTTRNTGSIHGWWPFQKQKLQRLSHLSLVAIPSGDQIVEAELEINSYSNNSKSISQSNQRTIILRHLYSSLTFGAALAILAFLWKSLFYIIFLKEGPPYFGWIFLWAFLGFIIFYVARHLGSVLVATIRQRPIPPFFSTSQPECAKEECVKSEMNRSRDEGEGERCGKYYEILKKQDNILHESVLDEGFEEGGHFGLVPDPNWNNPFHKGRKPLDPNHDVKLANWNLSQEAKIKKLYNHNHTTNSNICSYPMRKELYKIPEQSASFTNYVSNSATQMTREKIIGKLKKECEKNKVTQNKKYQTQCGCYERPLYLPMKPKAATNRECFSSDDDRDDGLLYDILQIPSRRRRKFAKGTTPLQHKTVGDEDDPGQFGDWRLDEGKRYPIGLQAFTRMNNFRS